MPYNLDEANGQDERMDRILRCHDINTIETYEADVLAGDIAWLYHAYREMRSSLAVIATEGRSWQDCIVARDTLVRVDGFDPREG